MKTVEPVKTNDAMKSVVVLAAAVAVGVLFSSCCPKRQAEVPQPPLEIFK